MAPGPSADRCRPPSAVTPGVFSRRPHAAAEASPELDRLVQTINARRGANYSLDRVAADIGIGFHLARLFRARVGCTLKGYVRAVRLEAAVGLVLAGESLHAAARSSGLRDAAQIREFLASRPHGRF